VRKVIYTNIQTVRVHPFHCSYTLLFSRVLYQRKRAYLSTLLQAKVPNPDNIDSRKQSIFYTRYANSRAYMYPHTKRLWFSIKNLPSFFSLRPVYLKSGDYGITDSNFILENSGINVYYSFWNTSLKNQNSLGSNDTKMITWWVAHVAVYGSTLHTFSCRVKKNNQLIS